MRTVVQRVSRASVTIDGLHPASIGEGLVILLGIHASDGPREIAWMADKIINLRIFEDSQGKMNLSLADIGAEMLIVSQFTLYGDCRKGRRPGFSEAAPPEVAEPLYHAFITAMQEKGLRVATGTFQAAMEVELVNSGPVTLLLDSDKKF
jgi:D-aminoacyl-tRNA deacylase